MEFNCDLENDMDKKPRSPALKAVPAAGEQVPAADTYGPCTIDVNSFADPVKYPGLFKASMRGVEQELVSGNDIEPPLFGSDEWFLQYRRVGDVEFINMDNGFFGAADLPLRVTPPKFFMEDLQGHYELQILIRSNFGNHNNTEPLPLTLDWTPPYGTSTPAALDLPLGPITSQWLADNDDKLDGQVVDYADQAPGDKAFVYWLKEIPDDITTLAPVATVDLDSTRAVSIPGSAIITVGDGECFALYVLMDAAGNPSLPSQFIRYQVSLGPLPTGLQAPEIPLHDDGVINIADLFEPVQVHIGTFQNVQPLDEIELFWDDEQLPGRYPIGENAVFPLRITIPANIIAAHFTPGGGRQTVPVRYRIARHGVHYDAPPADFVVNLDVAGPVNPGWPDPVNPVLALVEITSASGQRNYLAADDADQPATATLALDASAIDGDVIVLYWNGQGIAPHSLSASEITNGVASITVPWSVIAAQGNSPALPVHYSLASAADADNAQLSEPATIRVEAVAMHLPEPEFPDEFQSNPLALNCASLREIPAGSGSWGFRAYIKNDGKYLIAGNTITLEYLGFSDHTATQPVESTRLTESRLLTREEELYGVSWFIGPYESHILPTYNPASPYGACTLKYSLRIAGVEYPSAIVTRVISLFNGSITCRIPPALDGGSAQVGTLLAPVE